MPAYYLRLKYMGTGYQGYQTQPGGITTVQGEVEKTLSRIHKHRVTFNGCGRTDAGVHASQYYGHLDLPDGLPPNYLFILNKQLRKGISVQEVIPVHDKAHARFDAVERTYDFFFHGRRDAQLESCSSLLDLTGFAPALSARALTTLVGNHDFRAFCKSPDQHNTTDCRMASITLFQNSDGTQFRIRFVANRFLRGMIRILMRDIIDVGLGKKSSVEIGEYLTSGTRPHIIKLAPPPKACF